MSFAINGIRLRGARTHNLKNISLDLPRNQLTVITGVSGSGKSSLAFDTLYAEGQRRYVESLSAYARQFLGVMEPPDVDLLEGLSPAVAIQQKSTSPNPRSTVGTITEIYDYLRLLYARVGTPRCPEHGVPLTAQTIGQMVDHVLEHQEGSRWMLLSPIIRARKGEHSALLEDLHRNGFIRARIDGVVYELDEAPELDLRKPHTIEAIVDRFRIRSDIGIRISESFETALTLSGGIAVLASLDPPHHETLYSEKYSCPYCGYALSELEPRLFSFNHPKGACPSCQGLGTVAYADAQELDSGNADRHSCHSYPMDDPITAEAVEKDLEEEGTSTVSTRICPACNGVRLHCGARHVYLSEWTLPEITALSIKQMTKWVEELPLYGQRREVAIPLLKEIQERSRFLLNVGLDYITLDRRGDSLSGGEAQRIRLARQVGSGLSGVMYVLDEPSIGLHPYDNHRLLNTLLQLRDLGNTVIVVEHDEEAIRLADYVVDLGPGAGIHGGQVIAEGTPDTIIHHCDSLTGQYLSGRVQIDIPGTRRRPERMLRVKNARCNNLKNITAVFPIGAFTCVTGVSGSGKSTLICDTLFPYASHVVNGTNGVFTACDSIEGLEYFDKVINVDQSPIGRTPRSNPATYTQLFSSIRELFALTPESRSRGYTSSRFSFNMKGGRCEACLGEGLVRLEMYFLADRLVSCEQCEGKRYNRETLDIRYRGKTIYDVLNMTVEEAARFFSVVPSVAKKLETLLEVGLGYISLGQNAVTLSGGEAQRIKLAKELSRRETGKTLYILDEPTTGLHWHDIRQLLKILQQLCDYGNTVIVIEHHMDVVKTADWIVDLGPEGGDRGGNIVVEGSPEQVALVSCSRTGTFLKKILHQGDRISDCM